MYNRKNTESFLHLRISSKYIAQTDLRLIIDKISLFQKEKNKLLTK